MSDVIKYFVKIFGDDPFLILFIILVMWLYVQMQKVTQERDKQEQEHAEKELAQVATLMAALEDYSNGQIPRLDLQKAMWAAYPTLSPRLARPVLKWLESSDDSILPTLRDELKFVLYVNKTRQFRTAPPDDMGFIPMMEFIAYRYLRPVFAPLLGTGANVMGALLVVLVLVTAAEKKGIDVGIYFAKVISLFLSLLTWGGTLDFVLSKRLKKNAVAYVIMAAAVLLTVALPVFHPTLWYLLLMIVNLSYFPILSKVLPKRDPKPSVTTQSGHDPGDARRSD